MNNLRFLLTVALLFLLFGCDSDGLHPATKQISTVHGVVNNGGLNMRLGPGTNYAIIDRLGPHCEVVLTGLQQGGWVEVVAGDHRGYVARKYLNISTDISKIPYDNPIPMYSELISSTPETILDMDFADIYEVVLINGATFVNSIPLWAYVLIYIFAIALIFWLCLYYRTSHNDNIETRLYELFDCGSCFRHIKQGNLIVGYVVYLLGAMMTICLCQIYIDSEEVLMELNHSTLWLLIPIVAVTLFASFNLQQQSEAHWNISRFHKIFNCITADVLALYVSGVLYILWRDCGIKPRLMSIDLVYDSFWGMVGTMCVIYAINFLISKLWYRIIVPLLYPLNHLPVAVIGLMVTAQLVVIELRFLDDHFFGATFIVSLFILSLLDFCLLLTLALECDANRCARCHSVDVALTGQTDQGYSSETYRDRRDIGSWSPDVEDAYEEGYRTDVYHDWLTHHYCHACGRTWKLSHSHKISTSFIATSRHWMERR